jgi:SAM-dependent methyltransferase
MPTLQTGRNRNHPSVLSISKRQTENDIPMPDTVFAVRSPAPLVGLSDLDFDDLYEERIRRLSQQHWTPVRVAARAASLLVSAGATRILDIGSGVGKFCIVGDLTTDAEFVGVEQRSDLVGIARSAGASVGASKATFVHANVDSFSFDGFDGIYMYNPFYEHVSKLVIQIDHNIELSRLSFRKYVKTTIDKLAAMAPPVAVVMFHGFGGPMPPGYEFRGEEPAWNDRLELWTKR